MAVGLTPRQAELLAFIDSYLSDNDGISPSYIEMMEALGLLSKQGIHRLLTGLEERGLIRRLKARVRAIEVLKPEPPAPPPPPRIARIPVAAGRINADDHQWWPPYGTGGA